MNRSSRRSCLKAAVGLALLTVSLAASGCYDRYQHALEEVDNQVWYGHLHTHDVYHHHTDDDDMDDSEL